MTQSDGTPGTFRPADDMWEEATAKVLDSSKLQAATDKDTYLLLSNNHLTQFTSLKCVQSAMSRVCESKGVFHIFTQCCLC